MPDAPTERPDLRTAEALRAAEQYHGGCVIPCSPGCGLIRDLASALRSALAAEATEPPPAHPDGLRCPRCGSTDVVCHGRPHGHECRSCGHDGRTQTTFTQAEARLLSRSYDDLYAASKRLLDGWEPYVTEDGEGYWGKLDQTEPMTAGDCEALLALEWEPLS